MTHPEKNSISGRLHRILASHGKLALLIEDAPDAELRTSRELYGADGLPVWWACFDNIEEGAEAIAAVVDRPTWASHLPILVVLDRYLPVNRISTRAIPWDQKPGGAALGRAVAALKQEAERRQTLRLLAMSSYGNIPGDEGRRSDERSLDWQPRYQEPLFGLRRNLAADDALRPLLSFGPAPSPPLEGEAVSVEDRCRARHWHPWIEKVAEALREKDNASPCILLTGAGASLANHVLAPGVPQTWFLLDWASWQVCCAYGVQPPLRRPSWPEDRFRFRGSPREGRVHSLEELIDKYRSGISSARLDWSLETVLTPGSRTEPALRTMFLQAFRQALQQWDHDFPYHMWLLAQLPWSLILTTNFDSFHERAAASAASLARGEDVEQIRRLGDLAEGSSLKSIRRIVDLLPGAGLYKLHGSLMRVGPLAMTQDDFQDRKKELERIVEAVEKSKKCWLVIVGYRIGSKPLHDQLESLIRGPNEVRVVWVDPEACALACDRTGEFHFGWKFEPAVEGSVDEAARMQFCPLPARAIDFAYDLWGRYRQLG